MNINDRLNEIDKKFKQHILDNLDTKENYFKQVEELQRELGLSILTGTLIQDELNDLNRKICEKIAIVEFIRSCEDWENEE